MAGIYGSRGVRRRIPIHAPTRRGGDPSRAETFLDDRWIEVLADEAPLQLDPDALRIRVQRVVHRIVDHVVRPVVGHALGEDHERDGGGFAAAGSAAHGFTAP